jgi:predicted small lipoprotein YifL
MNRPLRTLFASLLVILVTGCGQSGPLYIPGNPSEIKAPPSTQQNTEQKAEDEKKEDDAEDPEVK